MLLLSICVSAKDDTLCVFVVTETGHLLESGAFRELAQNFERRDWKVLGWHIPHRCRHITSPS